MLSLAEAKAHLVITEADDDALISDLVDVAESHVAGFTQRTLDRTAHTETFTAFNTPMVLEKAPLLSVDSITYVDPDGVTQTLSSFQVRERGAYAEIYPAVGESWPSVLSGDVNSVTVAYYAGYDNVPAPLKQAALMILSSLYEQRENHIAGTTATAVPVSAEYLMAPYRILRL
jgi:uncharacterized phiE125 gp8 family phage protein